VSNGWASAFLDPSSWTSGIGGAVLGLVTGHFRSSRGRVAKLEKEVAECRARDADLHVVKAGVRLLVGEMVRENPSSPALQMFGDLLAQKLGPAPTIDEFADLIKDADEVDPSEWTGPKREWEDRR
jgi:hypothetical protein